MSWQAYVDSSLVGTKHVDKAAIISAAGDSTWAATPGFQVKPEEAKVVCDILCGAAGCADKAQAEGVYINGERFVVFKIEGRSIYGRKGKEGVCIVKTKQAILVSHYDENIQAGNSAATVEALADYLINAGY